MDKKRFLVFCIFLLLVFPLSLAETSDHTFIVNKYQTPQYIQAPKTSTILIEPIISEQKILPCQQADFSFKITNPSNIIQAYDFSVEDFNGVAFITPGILLKGQQSRIIQFSLLPECDLYGIQNPKILVETENEEAFVAILLDIEKAYDFTMESEEYVDICSEIESRIPVILYNKAALENNYELSVNRDWINPEFKSIVVKENSEAQFDLMVNPKDEGVFAFSLEATPKYGDQASKKITLNVQNCFKQGLQLPITKICELEDKLTARITNNGIHSETFELELEGPTFLSLVKTNIELNSGDEADVQIKILDKKPGKYDLVLKSHISGSPDKFDKDIKEQIEIIALSECYKLDLLTNKITISREYESHSLQVKNTGLDDETYLIEINGPPWVRLQTDKLFLNRNLVDIVTVKTFPYPETEAGNHAAELIFKSDTTGSSYVEKFVIRLSDYTFLEFIYMNKCCILFILFVIIAVAFFIKFLFDLTDIKKAISDLLVIVVVLLIMMLLLVFCFTTFKNKIGLNYQNQINESENLCQYEDICNSDFYIRFDEDNSHKIDLSKRFYDPDNDILEFSSNKIQDIDVQIFDDKAMLTPTKNWHGIREIFFTADDGHGGFVESRKFYIHVINKPEFYIQDFVLDNHLYLSIGALALLVLIILLLVYLLIKPE